MQNYRNLRVWRQGHALALRIQSLTDGWDRRNASLVSQLRRAAQSVPANIAEGSAKSGDKEFGRFLMIALGSAVELQSHLDFAVDSDLILREEFAALEPQVTQLRRMLGALLKRLKSPASKPTASSRQP